MENIHTENKTNDYYESIGKLQSDLLMLQIELEGRTNSLTKAIEKYHDKQGSIDSVIQFLEWGLEMKDDVSIISSQIHSFSDEFKNEKDFFLTILKKINSIFSKMENMHNELSQYKRLRLS